MGDYGALDNREVLRLHVNTEELVQTSKKESGLLFGRGLLCKRKGFFVSAKVKQRPAKFTRSPSRI